MKLSKTFTSIALFSKYSKYFGMFLFILLPVVGFLTGTKYQKENASTIILKPAPTIQNEGIPAGKDMPLLAYIKKENVYVYDPNIKAERQITKNGSIANIEWTKDGQWLYWYSQEFTADRKNSSVTFARGRSPDFKVEILFGLTPNFSEEIFSFHPLKKTDHLLVEQRDGLYLYDLYSRASIDNKRQRLLETRPIEGINSQDIKDSYGILDVSHDEKFVLLSHGGWEGAIDTGILNLSNLDYKIIPKTSGGARVEAVFSPNDNYILVSGVANLMGGSDTKGLIFHFPSLEIFKDIDEITGKVTGHGDFLSNNLVIYAVGHGDYYDPKTPYNKSIGISIVDLLTSKEILFVPYTLPINYDYPTIPDYIVKASQGFIFYTLYEQPWESGYFTYDFNKNEIAKKTTLTPFFIGELPMAKPQPIISQ